MDVIKDILIAYLPAFISVIGALVAIYKVKPETKKIASEANKNDGEATSAIGEAAESIAQGAKVTVDQLLSRIVEMEKRERARDVREEALNSELMAVKRQLNEWQDWASRLVFQIRSHGLEPVPFKTEPPLRHSPE